MTTVEDFGAWAGRRIQSRPPQYDPWIDLSGRDGIELTWHAEGTTFPDDGTDDEVLGVCDYQRLQISLLVGMDECQLRTTLTHELIHMERGPVPESSRAKEELAVELLTAKRLVDPVIYDLVVAEFGEDPPDMIRRRFLRVDRATLAEYGRWRARIRSTETAARAYRFVRYPAWPAPWMSDHADQRLPMNAARGLSWMNTAQALA